MPNAVIDACCLIDLLASGEEEGILRANGFTWHLPAVVQYCRRHDPVQPGQFLTVPADLSVLLATGLLNLCSPANQQELDSYVRYATLFRTDGEAMCLALAETRGWAVATDDRRAINVAQQTGLTVLSCPQLVKTWADATSPVQSTLRQVLQVIQVLAHFRPNPSMPECQWWVNGLAKPGP